MRENTPPENQIQILLDLRDKLNQLIGEKENHLFQIEQEIKMLKEQIAKITDFITMHSFTTADELIDTETFLKQNTDKSMSGQSLTRKIFTKNNDLLCVLKYEDKSIFIRFLKPEIVRLTQEKYINEFVKTVLLTIKQTETDLKPVLTKNKDNKELIETIQLQNVNHFESLDIIETQVRKVLGNMN